MTAVSGHRVGAVNSLPAGEVASEDVAAVGEPWALMNQLAVAATKSGRLSQ